MLSTWMKRRKKNLPKQAAGSESSHYWLAGKPGAQKDLRALPLHMFSSCRDSTGSAEMNDAGLQDWQLLAHKMGCEQVNYLNHQVGMKLEVKARVSSSSSPDAMAAMIWMLFTSLFKKGTRNIIHLISGYANSKIRIGNSSHFLSAKLET